MTRWWTTLAVVALAGLAARAVHAGPEYVEQTAPSSASAIENAIEYAFGKEKLSDRFLWRDLKETISDLPAFWRDTRMAAALRTYRLDFRNSSDSKREALTTGGKLWYQSGWWRDLSIRAAYYHSHDLGSEGGDTGLLRPGKKNISVVGEVNLRIRLPEPFMEGSEIRLYRQVFNMPYVNQDDSRMVPSTHEAYAIGREDQAFGYIAGHITKFKKRDRERFVPMSEAAGAEGTDKGLTVAGIQFAPSDRWSMGVVDLYGWDTFNTFYAETKYGAPIHDEVDFTLSAQFTDQRSVGDELVGDFETNTAGIRGAFGWGGAVLTVAATRTDDGSGIQSPWGGRPSYLSIQILDFDRANEKAFLVGFSYTNETLESVGLSGSVKVAHGFDAESSDDGGDLPDQTEYDFTIDYRPPGGMFEGLWIRVRYAHVSTEGGEDPSRGIRLIVNYEIPFL